MLRKTAWFTMVLAVWACLVFESHRVLADDSPSASQPGDVGKAAAKSIAPPNPKLVKLPFSFPQGMENTPVMYRGRPLLVQNRRSNKAGPEQEKADLFIGDLVTGQEVAKLGVGFSFVSAMVNGDEMNIFGTVNTSKEWTRDVYRFWSTDLKNWKQELAVAREDANQHLFNTSVCRDGQGYLMAYESNAPCQWSFHFARSVDLTKWKKVPDLEFGDMAEKSFCACPALRYIAPYYYVIYGIEREKSLGKHYQYQLPTTQYVAVAARSKDLVTWELSPCRGPMLDPTPGEGINNTDADLFEYDGSTYIYYATGDQATWGTIRVAMYAGPMQEMFEAHFPDRVATIKFDTKERKYLYP